MDHVASCRLLESVRGSVAGPLGRRQRKSREEKRENVISKGFGLFVAPTPPRECENRLFKLRRRVAFVAITNRITKGHNDKTTCWDAACSRPRGASCMHASKTLPSHNSQVLRHFYCFLSTPPLADSPSSSADHLHCMHPPRCGHSTLYAIHDGQHTTTCESSMAPTLTSPTSILLLIGPEPCPSSRVKHTSSATSLQALRLRLLPGLLPLLLPIQRRGRRRWRRWAIVRTARSSHSASRHSAAREQGILPRVGLHVHEALALAGEAAHH